MTDQKTGSSLQYKMIKQDILYKGFFSLASYELRHQLFNGDWSNVITREVMERSSAAAVLPYDPDLDRVVLIEQFRPAVISAGFNPWLTEIIAGIFEEGEAPEQVTFREAKEEAGCIIQELQLIYSYMPSPGGSNETIHLFCGRIDAANIGGIFGLKDEGEDIRAFTLSAEEAFSQLQNGYIKSSPAIIALQWLQLNRERLRTQWQKK